MGGHGDHEVYKVPSPDTYKVEDVPELKKLQEKLAEKGLKDPWLRNEVWRYTGFPGKRSTVVIRTLTRGLLLGIPLAIATIAVENALGITYKPAHHGGHDDHH